MPELDFKGKEFVRNHHLTVPFRPLVPDAEKSVGEPDLNGNLIIQGDNLEALKSLLPMYAGKVDCIFIDPPYNTGNEGWCYNDNVNSPTLKQWFSENPVGIDDSLRHDKWCAMMWPRLKLLWELLADTGSLWMTLDDNEAPKARILLDEIFGADSFVVNVAWQNKVSPANDAKQFSDDHDSLMVYAKHPDWQPSRLERNAEQLGYYSNPDSDTRGPWNSATYTCNKTKEERPSLFYPLNRPDGTEVWPSETAVWAYSKDASAVHVAEDRIYWGANSTGQPRLKVFLSEVRGVVPRSVWSYSDSGHTQMATQELRQLMGSVEFATPKPLQLLSKVISIAASKPEAIILDSFAGSGTTAHAVIKANAAGGGTRKFILVECEDYADTLTAERIRRAMNGYPFQGTQRETLMEKRLTWTEVRKGDKLVEEAENTRKLHEENFDQVKIEVKEGVLKVVGERSVEETAPGLGGSFTYCTLGDPLEIESLLSGEGLPSREMLATWLLYVSTSSQGKDAAPKLAEDLNEFFVAKQGNVYTWLLYRPDNDYLTSRNAVLTLDLARKICAVDPKAEHRVFSPAKYVSNKLLRDEKLSIEHATIPFALFRKSGS